MSRQLRRLLALVSAIVLVDVLFYSAITPLLPSYVEDLDLTKSEAGVLAGAYAFGTLITSLPAGWLAARWGARRTLLLGLGVLAVASVAFGFGESFGVLAGARLLQGFGGAAAWAAGMAWILSITPRERRGEVIGMALGTAIAGAIGGPVLGGLAEATSPELVFGAVGAVAGLLAMAVLATRIEGEPPPSGRLAPALRDRRVVAGAWLTTLPAIFFGTFGVLTPLRLDELGVGAAGIAAVFLLAAALEAIASPIVGRLSDRRGPLVPLRIGLLGVVIACLVIPAPDAAWLLAALVVTAAAVGGMLWAPATALLSEGADEAGLPQSVAFALVNVAWAGGQVAGSAGGAALADLTRDVVPYVLLAGLSAATFWLLLRRMPVASAHAQGATAGRS